LRLLSSITVAVFSILLPVAHAATPDRAAAIDEAVRDALRVWHVPGVAVAVIRDKDVVYLKGQGLRDIDKRQPVTPDTIFPLASCSKAFTSAALAILVDEGKLSWDDPVGKHVSFFHLADPLADRDVRIRDLLCHRTGVGSHDLLWYRAPWSPEEAVRRIALMPLDRPFRTAFQYQSTMYTAAGFAVRSAAGMPWEDYVRVRLLEPLQMKSTFLTSTTAARHADRASGYERGDNGEPAAMPAYPLDKADAAGSVHSTARDLARWLSFQVVGDKSVVSDSSLGETHTPQMVIPFGGMDREIHPDTVQMSYGMGWVIQDYRGRRLISHAGIIDGFRCHLTLVPDAKVGIAILANLHRTRMNQALSNTIVDRMLDLPEKDWNAILQAVVRRENSDAEQALRAREAARARDTRPSLPASGYVGVYNHPAFGSVRIAIDRGRLVWSFNTFSAALDHFENDTFSLPINSLGTPLVQFASPSGGEMQTLHVGGKIDIEFRRQTGTDR
jgi:CubicO group peptidase (beta-lactamase class C family)